MELPHTWFTSSYSHCSSWTNSSPNFSKLFFYLPLILDINTWGLIRAIVLLPLTSIDMTKTCSVHQSIESVLVFSPWLHSIEDNSSRVSIKCPLAPPLASALQEPLAALKKICCHGTLIITTLEFSSWEDCDSEIQVFSNSGFYFIKRNRIFFVFNKIPSFGALLN